VPPASEPRRALEPSPKPSPKLAMRAGDRATAVFVSSRLRLTARVTCLERGREGEVIRVRSQDGAFFGHGFPVLPGWKLCRSNER